VLWIGRRSLPFNAVPPSAPKLRPLDVLLNVAMFSLVFLAADALGARRGGAPDPQTRAMALGLLVAGLAIGAFYIRRQLRQEVPLFPVDLLRIRVFALSMCTSVTAFAAQTLAFIALPFLLLEGQGRSHFSAGLVLTAWPAAIVLVAPLVGRLIHRYPGGLLGGIGLGLLALGLAWLALLPDQPPTAAIVMACALCGLGFGIFQSPNNHTIVTSAPLRRAGAASGMLGSARLTGQSLGAVLLGLIFGAVGVAEGGPIALGLAAALAAASAIFSALRIRS
jgi:DHA2 family multidrug resistance protein-like MFS transporter